MLARRRPFAAPLPVALFAVGLVSCVLTARVASPVPPHGEWPTHGGTNANARYSSLDQITRDNVRQLRIAWRWMSPDHELMARQPQIQTWSNQATPLMIGGVLYVSTSLSQVAAIEAISGRMLWVHDPKIWVHGTPANFGSVHRGVAHWTDGRDARILIGTGNAYLIALDARTGTPITTFGDTYLKTVGIRTRMRPLERAAFFAQVRDRKPRNLLQAANGAYGNAATRIERDMTSGGFSYGSYPEIDDLFHQQARETDRKKREALLHQIQKIAYDRVMFAPIWEFAQLHGVGARVEEPGLGLIELHPFSSPYEDLRLRK